MSKELQFLNERDTRLFEKLSSLKLDDEFQLLRYIKMLFRVVSLDNLLFYRDFLGLFLKAFVPLSFSVTTM